MNWTLWSSVGFWVLMAGLAGNFAVLFISSSRLKKRLAATFMILIAIEVAVEHFADARLLKPRTLSAAQRTQMTNRLRRLAGTAFMFAVTPEPEPINFMGQVNDVPVGAGSKWEPANHDKKTELIILVEPLKAAAWTRSGIVAGFRADAPKTLLTPADNLATAFEKAGFSIDTGTISDTVSANSDAVYVVIATK